MALFLAGCSGLEERKSEKEMPHSSPPPTPNQVQQAGRVDDNKTQHAEKVDDAPPTAPIVIIGNKHDREAAEAAAQEGRGAYQAGRWEEAYRKLEVAAKLQKDNLELGDLIRSAREHHRAALVADAKVAESKGDLDRTVLVLTQAFAVLPGTELATQLTTTKYVAGKKAFQEGRFREAHSFLKDARGFEDASQLDDRAKMELDLAAGVSLLAQARDATQVGDYNTAYTRLEDALPKLSNAPAGRPVPLREVMELRDRLKPQLYRMGVATAQRNNLEDAESIFRRLGDYNDSRARLSEIEARQAEIRRLRNEAIAQEPQRKEEELKKEAWSMSKEFVADRLRTPSTATFRMLSVTALGNGSYRCVGNVEAQVPFGGRNGEVFVCDVTLVDAKKEQWHCDRLEFDR